MKKTLTGKMRMRNPGSMSWSTYEVEFDVESETDPAQEAHDRILMRKAERAKRSEDLARQFTGQEDASFLTCMHPVRKAILFILDQELPLL